MNDPTQALQALLQRGRGDRGVPAEQPLSRHRDREADERRTAERRLPAPPLRAAAGAVRVLQEHIVVQGDRLGQSRRASISAIRSSSGASATPTARCARTN